MNSSPPFGPKRVITSRRLSWNSVSRRRKLRTARHHEQTRRKSAARFHAIAWMSGDAECGAFRPRSAAHRQPGEYGRRSIEPACTLDPAARAGRGVGVGTHERRATARARRRAGRGVRDRPQRRRSVEALQYRCVWRRHARGL